MVSALSKRQQARNERALQELIKSVPGNERCADCQARNPGWASWNLGAFLCMRCAALHRKLGTHISKVKSLSMDSWSSDQVDNMKRNGNNAVNKIYNPRNVKPPIPMDVDEVDSAMEKFIRQKYEYKILEDGKPKPPSRHDSGYTNRSSDDSQPPPLPPKTGKRFGFGLRASSANPLSRSSTSSSPRDEYDAPSPPIPSNKQSRVFGTSVGDINDPFESKLIMLRDMGFPDHKKNATVLKGLNGNLDKTVETLVRLGEGSGPASGARTPVPPPAPSNSQFPDQIEVPKRARSTNPFDQLDAAPPGAGISINQGNQPSTNASTAPQQPTVKPVSYNPFDVATPQPLSAQPLDESFRNLQVSQPLFPNITGGYPSQQGQVPQPRYQQSMTPPVSLQQGQQGYMTAQPPANTAYNPFLQSAPQAPNGQANPNPYQPQLSPSNPYLSQMSAQSTGSQSQSPISPQQPPSLQHSNTFPMYSAQQAQQPPQQQQFQQPQQQANPFASMSANNVPQQPYQQQQQQQFQTQSQNPYQAQLMQQYQQPQLQSLQPQPTGRADKSSILALYKFSQPPPSIPEQPSQPQQQQQQMQQQMQQPQQQPALSQNQTPFTSTTQRSATMPVSTDPVNGNRNPFFTAPPLAGSMAGGQPAMGTAQPSPFAKTHVSQESVDIGGLQNGRHSPDAFASLSARYVR
ncbi:hypothetical protein FQN54_001796 [Arachnomyces sp. PD_36]|nr:hypothetical protein FQN54_001796 [Arachnomyces sp. PD_36]